VRLYDSQMEGADRDDFIRNEWASGAMRQLLKELHMMLDADNAEAEFEALMMKVAEEVRYHMTLAKKPEELDAIVRRVLDEKGRRYAAINMHIRGGGD
jgi:hypothetical protein